MVSFWRSFDWADQQRSEGCCHLSSPVKVKSKIFEPRTIWSATKVIKGCTPTGTKFPTSMGKYWRYESLKALSTISRYPFKSLKIRHIKSWNYSSSLPISFEPPKKYIKNSTHGGKTTPEVFITRKRPSHVGRETSEPLSVPYTRTTWSLWEPGRRLAPLPVTGPGP